MEFYPRARDLQLAFSLRQVAYLLPHELHHEMTRRDAHLLRAPAELPEWECIVVFGDCRRVVVARYVAEAEEYVGEAVLVCVLV